MSKWILIGLVLLSLVACTCNADQPVKIQEPQRFIHVQTLRKGKNWYDGDVYEDTLTGNLIIITVQNTFVAVIKKENNNE